MANREVVHRRKALTLLELLTVVSILLLLTALLMSVLLQARKRGQEPVCLSNLRQLGTARLMYTYRLP